MKYNLIGSLVEQIVDGAQARLTDTQKIVLTNIYAAPTPETAYDSVTGHQNLVVARNQLRSMNLVVVDDTDSRAGITDEGYTALSNNNLIDDIGELTEEGNSLLIKATPNTEVVREQFTLLKTII